VGSLLKRVTFVVAKECYINLFIRFYVLLLFYYLCMEELSTIIW
jgi:hypothetical protein